MAARVLLFSIACTLGLIGGKTVGNQLGVRLGAEPPPEAVAIRGRGFALQCGPPAPGTVITWLKDGRPIKADSRIWVAPNATLIFNKVLLKKKGVSDAGEYRCLARNSNGALLSRPSRLIIPVLSHEFKMAPESKNVSEGDVTRLTCSIESTPLAAISWLKDSQVLPHSKRFTAFDSGILYITNVKQEDAGSYSCEARNPYVKKTPRSKDGLLVVAEGGPQKLLHFLPESPPASVTVKEGKSASLVCAVSGVPLPVTIWSYTKSDGSNYTLQTTKNGLNVLRLNKVSPIQHSGTYVCTATQTTKDKTYTISKKVVVIVETPPVIIEKPKSQTYPAAKTMRIDCEVKGHPQPQVVWYKDGVRLLINGRIKQNAKELVLGAAVSNDTGIYQCFAGDVWAAGRLVVNISANQPLPPTNLTCTPLSPTQIQLSWSPNQPGIQAYSIHYFPTEGGEEYKDVSPNNTYTVQKLQPYTNYTFYIRSYGKSASEQSRRVICSTGETVPTGGPQVNVTITGSQCLLVTWSPPPINEARGAITNYKVQWKRVNQSSVNFEILPAYINQYRISGLESGEKYMIRVMGATALGWPEFADTQNWTNITLPATSKFPPLTLSVSPVNSTAIRVDWTYTGTTIIDGFILGYKKVRENEGGSVKLPANVSSYLISKLESGSWYDISMKAFSGDIFGEECSETVLVGGDSSLPPPTLMEAAPISPSSIRVSWRPPPHSFVSHYTVEITSTKKTLKTLTVNKTSVEVTSLNGNSVYEVRVKAHGPHNESSAYSLKLECRTPPYVIDPVSKVSWKEVNGSAVLVSWTPLSVPLYNYEIFYTRDFATPINLWHSRSAQPNQSSVLITGLKSSTSYVIRVRAVGASGPGPLSSNLFIKLSQADDNLPIETLKPHKEKDPDQLLGILVGCGISLIFVFLCTGSIIFKRKCLKNSAQPSQHEMASLTQLHTKVGVLNGQVNGLKLFPNGRVPNGHTALRITENPQCQAGGSSPEEREGESLLNETLMTTVDLSHNTG